MALSVIGAGFGRTGTMSLKLALEQLGFGRCHHMEEVLKNPAQLPFWQDAAAGRKIDWDAVFAGFGSAVDWPSAHFWRELAQHYPQAKVVLTVRPEESWWNSYSQTIQVVLRERANMPPGALRDTMEMAAALVEQQTFHGAADKNAILAAYRKRQDDVRAAIAPPRLLVFDVAQGWAPLCRFLEKPVPAAPFPRTNNVAEFWELAGKGA